jgi:hypothetical protein
MVTVVETVYHQPAGLSPVTVLGDSSRFHRELKSNEQHYERHRVATEEWKQLDTGWVDSVGMLLVKNEEGQFPVVPTEEYKAEVMSRVLQLSFDAGKVVHILVLPGETIRFTPKDAKMIYVNCAHETARYTVAALPE